MKPNSLNNAWEVGLGHARHSHLGTTARHEETLARASVDAAEYPYPERLSRLYDFTEPEIRRWLHGGAAALDVGCGDGRLARLLLEWGASKVLAFDISREVLDQARAENPGPEYRLGDAEDPSFLAVLGRFDFILIRNTFHHFEDKERFLKTLPALLNPGGTFLLVDLDAESNFYFVGVAATHLRYVLSHRLADSLSLIRGTRVFLSEAMRRHRRDDGRRLRRQGWFTAAESALGLRSLYPDIDYYRIGQILGFGGAYVGRWVRRGDNS